MIVNLEILIDVLGPLFGSLGKLGALHGQEVVLLLLAGEGYANLGPLELIQVQPLTDRDQRRGAAAAARILVRCQLRFRGIHVAVRCAVGGVLLGLFRQGRGRSLLGSSWTA